MLSSTSVRRPEACTQTAARASTASTTRMVTTPCGRRRTASTLHAMTWAKAVATAIHSSIAGRAVGSRAGPTTYDVTPSSPQAWISHEMLSGASSSAPRWSLVALIGNATPCSRDDHLPAAARGDGRDGRDQQDAGHGGRQQDAQLEATLVVGGHEGRDDRRADGDRAHDEEGPPVRRAAAYGGGAEAHQVAHVADRTPPGGLGRRAGRPLSRGEPGRHEPPPHPTSPGS